MDVCDVGFPSHSLVTGIYRIISLFNYLDKVSEKILVRRLAYLAELPGSELLNHEMCALVQSRHDTPCLEPGARAHLMVPVGGHGLQGAHLAGLWAACWAGLAGM